ncbi:helix-turn-helix transcriptional regulator [Clostridium malenominatum]|uniref:Helix-turn-helix transcriptional regulator n=1 Tax=Clostridium malenominatum TaxID=1539 RepID=A0ABP3U1Y0_9CLOT
MALINKELERLIPVANLIAKTFGKHCEVVIHDLSHPQSSVVYTVNNIVTGREVGQGFDHLVKQVLLSKKFKDDCSVNYMTKTKDGKKIKSSTALIRDSKGKVIGALCVNYDLDVYLNFKEVFEDLLYVEEQVIDEEVEPFPNVAEIVDDLIDKIIEMDGVDELKRKDKIELIRFMEKKGIFLMKGAIDKVAEKLGISKVTVYSYLDIIKKEGE